MLDAMRQQWRRFPPLSVMVAHYLGAAKPDEEEITSLEEQNFVPAQKLSKPDFEALVQSMGLPTDQPDKTP